MWYTLSLTQYFLFESHARAISFTQSQLFDPLPKNPTKILVWKLVPDPFCVCKELSTTSIGRLTDRAINLLQNYFGMAIRQNNDISSMKQAIEAVLFHCPESEHNDQRHFFCPRTEKSLMWMERNTGKETHKTKISSLSAIKTLVKPIFVYLSNNSLLETCLHRKTQNVN